ncbi:unnamed protein product [Clonostachys rosea]|uniref:Histone chaperone RTT106/FACT complex subunit SPT16-like middle domain-containing protein n=1 Tax=Bionectria ochroleuca TaxID=29856 RepID=A0ABY6UPW4_BIOOC|nr:unnamed protein product [Clonostachys rosea]
MGGEDELPRTRSDWARNMKEWRHLAPGISPYEVSLDGVTRLDSASKLEHKDYLLLRVLSYPDNRKPTPVLLFGSAIGSELEKDCRQYLEKQPWWSAVQSREPDPNDWGVMAPWKTSQLEIAVRSDVLRYSPREYDLENLFAYKVTIEPASGPPDLTPEPERRPRSAATAGQDARRSRLAESSQTANEHGFDTEPDAPRRTTPYAPSINSVSSETHLLTKRPPDEAVVNKSVCELLQGITMNHPAVKGKYKWSIFRKTFHVLQIREKVEKVMTSQTDGCLQIVRDNFLLEDFPTLSIIEAKPIRRKSKLNAISRQEGAEMAAWISTEPFRGLLPVPESSPSRCGLKRRVLISQDFDEICITVAEYDDAYIEYITHGFESAEMNSTQSSPTARIQSRRNEQTQKRPQEGEREREQMGKKQKGDGEDDFESQYEDDAEEDGEGDMCDDSTSDGDDEDDGDGDDDGDDDGNDSH